jgi:hypothetical protein
MSTSKRRLELVQTTRTATSVAARSAPRIGRREALLGAGALFVAGCGKDKSSFTCMDVSALSAEDAQARAQSQYVDRTTEAGKNCESCQQFVEGKDGCGTCKLLKGPVHPWGYCKVYAKKG